MGQMPAVLVLALALAVEARAGSTLFGRRLRATEESPRQPSAPRPEPARESEDPFAKGGEKPRSEPEDPFARGGEKPRAEPEDPFARAGERPREDGQVRIRPVEMARAERDAPVESRMEFRLSRVDKPLSPETSALFREGWAAFLSQHAKVDGRFERLPGAPLPLRLTLRQDLGEGRWLVEAAWTNPGVLAWCPAGANLSQAVVVLDRPGQPGERRSVNALRIGLVEASFVAQIPPAEGRRVTLRRHAFVETAPLADDAATREAFEAAVRAGQVLRALVVQQRDCRECGGWGFVRRKVPGKIQDARDPCPSGCDQGKDKVGLELTFRP